MDILDDVTGGGPGLLKKLKLTRELIDLRQKIGEAGDGALAAMNKLKMTRRIIEIRAELGVSGKGGAEPVKGAAELEVLREVAAGKHDDSTLQELYGRIATAVHALNDAGLLTGDAEAAAHAAIDRWASLEEKANV